MKKKHSKFYYSLENLIDKIVVYKQLFHSKMPENERKFLERKKAEMEKKLKEEQENKERKLLTKSVTQEITFRRRLSKFSTAGSSPLRQSHIQKKLKSILDEDSLSDKRVSPKHSGTITPILKSNSAKNVFA